MGGRQGSAPRSGTCLWKVFPARKVLGAGARSRVLQKSSTEGEWHVRGAWHQAEAPLRDKPPYTAPAGRAELPNTSSVWGGTSRPFPHRPKHVDGPQRLGEGSVVLVSPPSGTQPGADTTFEPQKQNPPRLGVSSSPPAPALAPRRTSTCWPFTSIPCKLFGHGVLAPSHPHVHPALPFS